ncbi:DUF2637 domain-containing protein [Kitasatospora sp. NPDC056783]|uniref:DUF2637 domain-containing protein n=1 Tax=Kitasatospora sp. NPDC056783 TaxID=3345943 RepID=UPI0036B799FA
MSSSAVEWTRGRKATLVVIGIGASIIAAIGFWGSYSAVKELALSKGFGDFSSVFPIGIDVGIVVILALDLYLTSVRLGWPPLRYIAWVLTGATITFNAAASWPDLLGSAMHTAIPLLFIAVVEATRNALAKINKLAERRRLDSIRIPRWIIAPRSTFRIWRRMVLWEIPDFQTALRLDQQAQLLRMELRDQYGRGWRRKAGRDALRPLRNLRAGVPIDAEGLTEPAIPVLQVPPAFQLAPALEDQPVPDRVKHPAAETSPPHDERADPSPTAVPTTTASITPTAMPGVDVLPPADIPAPSPIAAPPAADAPLSRVPSSVASVAVSEPEPAAVVEPAQPQAAPLDPASPTEPAPATAPADEPAPAPVNDTTQQRPEPAAVDTEPDADPYTADEDEDLADEADGDQDLFGDDSEKTEEQHERAERIYKEHLAANKRISGAELARQAGYSPAHGRRLLARFGKEYGEIVPASSISSQGELGSTAPEPALT